MPEVSEQVATMMIQVPGRKTERQKCSSTEHWTNIHPARQNGQDLNIPPLLREENYPPLQATPPMSTNNHKQPNKSLTDTQTEETQEQQHNSQKAKETVNDNDFQIVKNKARCK